MSEQENLQIMQKLFEAANAHDVDRILEFVDDAYVAETDTLPGPIEGRGGYRQALQMYYEAFPDVRYDIEQMIGSGDFVVTRVRLSGTHQGKFRDNPATNRRFGFHLCHFDRLKNGKIVHGWVYWDTATLLRQLGLPLA